MKQYLVYQHKESGATFGVYSGGSRTIVVPEFVRNEAADAEGTYLTHNFDLVAISAPSELTDEEVEILAMGLWLREKLKETYPFLASVQPPEPRLGRKTG